MAIEQGICHNINSKKHDINISVLRRKWLFFYNIIMKLISLIPENALSKLGGAHKRPCIHGPLSKHLVLRLCAMYGQRGGTL